MERLEIITFASKPKLCETELQKWGEANRVTFEPDKQHMSIISLHEPEGDDFKMMGIWFDTTLNMGRAITEMCNKLRWKITTLLRSNAIFDTKGLIKQFKSRVLSYVECRTAAIYHANATALDAVDRQFNRFLRDIGLTRLEALMEFHLAPLKSRKDMAMFGVIHRAVLGLGPEQVRNHFIGVSASAHPDGRNTLRRHSRQLQSYRSGKFLEITAFSILGLIDVYNLLPERIVRKECVHTFQRALQEILKDAATNGNINWEEMFPPEDFFTLQPTEEAYNGM